MATSIRLFIDAAGGKLKRRGPPTLAQKQASDKWKREMRRKHPKRFEGKVVGHTPDAHAGGPYSGGQAMALSESVNSSLVDN